jgi:succinate-semialdehyde dehydrogenase/glutarate-semialdehyde dehydrogenase
MISQSAKQKVQAHLDDAQARGAQIIPCQPLQSAGDDDDHQAVVVGDLFQRPYLLDNCTMDMLVGKEETFGPLVPIIEFDTEQDVVRMANQSQVGLAAYFFSRDIGRIWRVAEQLQVGMVF